MGQIFSQHPVAPLPSQQILIEAPVLTEAARRGDVAVVEALLANNCPMEAEALNLAALWGRVQVVKVLLANNCPIEAEALNLAARNGRVQVVKVLLANNCPMEATALTEAAGRGHVTVVEALLANNCPMKAKALNLAAREGHVRVVEALLVKGCEITSEALSLASDNVKRVLEQAFKKQNAADLYATMLLFHDEYLKSKKIENPTGEQINTLRYFQISKKLSNDVQELLANRTFELTRDVITETETAQALTRISPNLN